MPRLGVDIGGTKIEIAVFDDERREVLRRREPTPKTDYASAIEFLAALVRVAERAAGATCTVGIGTPGAIDAATGWLKNAYGVPYNGKPLQRDLGVALAREVRIENDANCFALSEATDGAGRGANVVFGVILGTGVGGGIVANGRILRGANAIAGEWGHNPLPWPAAGEYPGGHCSCGRRDCIEAFLSGPALTHDYQRASGSAWLPAAIVAGAQSGNSECEAALSRYEERLARSLAHVINLLDPDVIVLGGGMSNVERLYRNAPRLWDEHVYSESVVTRLAQAVHGDSSGVRGAAWLW